MFIIWSIMPFCINKKIVNEKIVNIYGKIQSNDPYPIGGLRGCVVSRRTLYKWLHPYEDKLRKLGVQPNAKVIPPKAVRFICETFTIDID